MCSKTAFVNLHYNWLYNVSVCLWHPKQFNDNEAWKMMSARKTRLWGNKLKIILQKNGEGFKFPETVIGAICWPLNHSQNLFRSEPGKSTLICVLSSHGDPFHKAQKVQYLAQCVSQLSRSECPTRYRCQWRGFCSNEECWFQLF